jgi:hypothetical protein
VFQATDSLTLSEVRNEEAVHDLDLDGDGNIGDTIADTYFNIPDSNVEIDDPKDNWGIYKTETNAYLIDVSDLYTGSQTVSPTILTNENVIRGKITKSLYQFKYIPVSAVKDDDGNYFVFNQDQKNDWYSYEFNKEGIFQKSQKYSLSELLNSETYYGYDLNLDNNNGDKIESFIGSNGSDKSLYQTSTGAYIIDENNLEKDDFTINPLLLIKEKVSRGNITSSVYEFKYDPISLITKDDGSFSIYYQDNKNRWFRDSFDSSGVYLNTNYITQSELLHEEIIYSNDINNDGQNGDLINKTLVEGETLSIYETNSKSFIIDNIGLKNENFVQNPTLLKKVSVKNKLETVKLYSIKYEPSALVTDSEGNYLVYFQDNKKRWFKDIFNSDGNHQSLNLLNESQILNDESQFNMDFNNDGNVGDVISDVLANSSEESKGLSNWGLYKTQTNSFVLDIANKLPGDTTSTPILLTKIIRNKPYLYKFKYLPEGAVILNDSINVYHKDNRDRWYKDKFDSSGKFENTSRLDLNQVLSDELTFNIDLNNDNFIGDVVESVKTTSNVVDSLGHKFSIYQTVSKAYVFDNQDLSYGDNPGSDFENPITLKKQISKRGKISEIIHKFSYDISGLLAYENGDFEVFYSDSRKRWFGEKFDKEGIFKGSTNISLNQLLVNESNYLVDLNNDGYIGDLVNQKMFTSKTDDFGLYKTNSGSLVIDDNSLDIGDYTSSPILLTILRKNKYSIMKYNSAIDINGVVKFESSENYLLFYEFKNRYYKSEFNSEGVFRGTDYYRDVSILLNDEATFNEDLNNDGHVGDTIKSVKYDGSRQNDDFSIYQTSSGAYIFDDPMLDVVDVENPSTVSPLILTKTSRNTIYEYQNNNEFLGAVKNEVGSSIYHQDVKGRWYKDNFDNNGHFLNTEKYNIDLVLNDEHEHLKDLNQDQHVGFNFLLDESKDDLLKSETGSYVFDNNGDYQLLLGRRGNIYNFGNIEPISTNIEEVNNEERLIVYGEYKGSFYKSSFNETTGKNISNAKYSFKQLLEEEEDKNLDLNDDGQIG